MSRSLSSTFLEAIYSQETSEVFLLLLEIDHDDLSGPIRVANNYANVTSSGNTYVGFPFELSLPADFEDQLPAITLTICNVDRQVVDAVRTIDGPATADLSVVLASDPDTIEIGPLSLTLREVSYDALTVSGSLQPEDLLNEPFPGDIFSPGNYPGLF